MADLAANLREVMAQIRLAEAAAGRASGSVHLIAVSKTKPIEMIRTLYEAGHRDFGENRVQELVPKQAALPDARWHLIGGLQTNKVRQIIGIVHRIHSVDSTRLLDEIEKQTVQRAGGREVGVLLQVNISGEPQKGGFEPDEPAGVLQEMLRWPHVKVWGLMGMAEFTEDEGRIAEQFGRLAALFQTLKKWEGPQVEMRELSMGMSGDFPLAIAAGATHVRVGSSIFGDRH